MRYPQDGGISIEVQPHADGGFECDLKQDVETSVPFRWRFRGQNRRHALSIALENLAHQIRLLAEEEQNVEWDAVEKSPSGKPVEKKYHIILHYECLADEISKFEAMHNTMLGNTVVENAVYSIIQVDSDHGIVPPSRRRG